MTDIKFHEDDLKTICDAIREAGDHSRLDLGFNSGSKPLKIEGVNEALYCIAGSIQELADAIKMLKEKQ